MICVHTDPLQAAPLIGNSLMLGAEAQTGFAPHPRLPSFPHPSLSPSHTHCLHLLSPSEGCPSNLSLLRETRADRGDKGKMALCSCAKPTVSCGTRRGSAHPSVSEHRRAVV